MKSIEAINKIDTINGIKEDFDRILSYSQNVPTPLATDDLLSRWYDNKKRFIDKFGGQLIYELPDPITFEIPEKDRKTMVTDLSESFSLKYHNEDIADFVFETRADFFSNILSKDYTSASGKVIKKGSKIIKAFKHFESNKELLTMMQNEASMLVQSAKVSGTLCMSVHPIDFLSSSENTYNWRSCHALDGEYCAGNLSYMADKVTVMFYLKGDKEANLPNFPPEVMWNDKKWRMLMFVGEDNGLIFAGRQYPFTSDNALTICGHMLMYRMGFEAYRYSNWTDGSLNKVTDNSGNTLHLNSNYLYIDGCLVEDKRYIMDADDSRHYNDLLYSSYYKPKYIWKEIYCFSESCLNYKPLTIGSETKCIKCGKHHTMDTESMLCSYCYDEYIDSEDMFRCTCCGERHYQEDAYIIQDTDEIYCPSCADRYAGFCESCGCFYLTQDLVWDEDGTWCSCRECSDGVKLDMSEIDF